MSKIKGLILILAIFFINGCIVKADNEEYYLSKRRFANVYAVYDGTDRVHLFYGQTYIINNLQAYCIEPGVAINTNTYYATDDYSITNLDNETLKKIRLIAYYGYNYPYVYHYNDHYFMAAQELIWRTITGRDIYWVSTEDVNGPRIDIDKEKKEIESLVTAHYTIPSFANQTYEIEAGEKFNLKDDNNVLSRFNLYSSSVDNITINKDEITISPTSINESGEVNLVSTSYADNIALIYYNGDNQKLMSSTGVLEPVTATFKVKIIQKPMIKVIKVDDNNKTIKIKGIKFKIKNIDTDEYICDNLECIYVTDETGSFKTTTKFANGSYQIEELDQKIDGYLWNSEPLVFTIDDDTEYLEDDNELYLQLKFQNKKVTGSIEITKVGEKPIFKDNHLEYTEYKLDNVVFNLYAKSNINDSDNTVIYNKDDFINTYKTVDGKIFIENLPLGDYYLKEVSTVDNHILDREQHNFTLEYVDQYTDTVKVSLNLKNYLQKGVLEFTKTDSDTGLFLPNTKIGIYTSSDELYYLGMTNDSGKIIVEGLPLGSYYIKEIEPANGYTLNKEKIYFKIKDNEELVKANMENTLIRVPSTNLNKNYLIYVISMIILIIGGCLFIHEKK